MDLDGTVCSAFTANVDAGELNATEAECTACTAEADVGSADVQFAN